MKPFQVSKVSTRPTRIAGILIGAAVVAAPEARAQLTDLGGFGGSTTYAIDVNEAGDVLVFSHTSGDLSGWAAVYRGGQLIPLTLDGTFSFAVDLNEAGDALANQYDSLTGRYRGVLFRGGVVRELSGFGAGLRIWPKALNEAGDVVGTAELPSGLAHAFLHRNGTITDLGSLGYTHSEAMDVNEAGDVVGYAYPPDWNGHRAVLFRGGSVIDLGSLGGRWANALRINDAGDILGTSTLPGDEGYHPFLYTRHGALIDVSLGGLVAQAFDMNEAGDVVGYSYLPGGPPGETSAFLHRNGATIALNFGGDWISGAAADVNEAGDVVGWTSTPDGQQVHTFLYREGQMIDLGTLGGNYSQPFAINEQGDVVGVSSTTGDQSQHAFLYEDGQMHDLGTLGSTYSYASWVTDSGHVVGTSSLYGASGQRAFLTHVDLWPIATQAILTDLGAFLDAQLAAGAIDVQAASSLAAKVDAATSALARGKPNDATVAMNELKALVNYVQAQSGKKITSDAAAVLIDQANRIVRSLGG